MPNTPFFSVPGGLYDDKGNRIFPNDPKGIIKNEGLQKGNSKTTDLDGNKYPIGFTPPEDYIINFTNVGADGYTIEGGNALNVPSGKFSKGNIETQQKGFTPEVNFFIDNSNINDTTGLPFEYGNTYPFAYGNPTNKDTNPRTTNDKKEGDIEVYNLFNDGSGADFLHSLDRPIPVGNSGGSASSDIDTNQIYLGSYVQTTTDNEDPTIYGYDIVIDYANSPLFNGALENFLTDTRFATYDEISSRLDIYNKFIEQFFKFFKSNVVLPNNTTNSSIPNNIFNNSINRPKTYYLKKLSGLENLVEQNTSDKTKSFVEYGKDMIGLTIYEDVTMNMGYLSTLYKTLSWSRISGKKAIPENLLRFDAEIIITEIRKYNRVVKASSSQLISYADMLSKYRYKLYECQFFFPKMPHGSELNMSDAKMIDEFEIMFNYKFSTLKLEKMTYSENMVSPIWIDNSLKSLGNIAPNETNSAVIDDQNIQPIQIPTELNRIDNSANDILSQLNRNESLKNKSTTPSTTHQITQSFNGLKKKEKPIDTLLKKIKKAGATEFNRQVAIQARLLNRTLDNIRNSIGLGRMSEPTNVYSQYNITGLSNQFESDVKNAFRNFVGQSLKGFFGNNK